MSVFERRRTGIVPPVLWTRGQGCGELAALLSDGDPVRVKGDVAEECIRHRADLLVSRRLSDFDLVSQAVPIDFEPEEVGAVVAAVAGGPHSPLAARIARQLGDALGRDALMACAYRDEPSRERAVSLIEHLYQEVPELEYRVVEAEDAAGLVAQLPERSMLVLGAPGGNWFQRTIFGQGARLRQRSPSGAVVVKRAPTRVFQVMIDPVFVGPLRQAGDILRVHHEAVLAVVDRARLVGLVDRAVLEAVDPETPVSAVMTEPESVRLDAPVEDAMPLADRFGSAPLPVVDDDGMLVGGLPLDPG